MDKSLSNPLEQFLILVKSAKGKAAVELIKQVLEVPNLYVFGEFLDCPNIQELKSNPEHSPYFDLLEIFAYGTLQDYNENKEKLPVLTPNQLSKLKHLSIISMATNRKCLPYDELLKKLQFTNLRDLEDLIIEVISSDIIKGKLDQKQQYLVVEKSLGRDVRPQRMQYIIAVLQNWSDSCDAVLAEVEGLVKEANNIKDNNLRQNQNIELEVLSIKKSLKTMQQQEMEDQVNMDLTSSSDKVAGKKIKSKPIGPKSAAPSFSPKTPSK